MQHNLILGHLIPLTTIPTPTTFPVLLSFLFPELPVWTLRWVESEWICVWFLRVYSSAILILSIHQLLDIWISPIFVSNEQCYLDTCGQSFVVMCIFSILLAMGLGMEFLGHMVILCLTFWGSLLQAAEGVPVSQHPHQLVLPSFLPMLAILAGGSPCGFYPNFPNDQPWWLVILHLLWR